MKPVKHIDIVPKMKVDELTSEMYNTGVMGSGSLGKAAKIFIDMVNDKDCTVFLGAAGALIPGGMKNILVDMLNKKHINVLVTTGAMITHDLAEALGHHHYQGSSFADDGKLHEENLNRMYDSLMKNEVYQDIENFIEQHLDELNKQEKITEFLWVLGKYIKKPNSILSVCYKNSIPIFCPSLADSGIGLMIWGQQVKGKPSRVKAFEDLQDIIDITWKAKKTGVLYLGGGVPKNYIQQALQISPNGAASYGIQITLDRPEHGGSSGAKLNEGISWGKLKAKATWVDVTCDVTIALPIIYAALMSETTI